MNYYFIENYQRVFEREDEINLEIFPQFIPLTEDQVAYYLEHPEAGRYEIEHKDDPVYTPTLEEVKADKIREITIYDVSENVNQFFIGEDAVWLDKATRTSLSYTIGVEEESGKEYVDLWYDIKKYTLPISSAKVILAQIEAYAYKCFNVTAQHKANVSALTEINDVTEYDFTVGYPEKLHFAYETVL